MVSFTGTQYLYSGKELPEFFPWAMREVRLDYKNQKLKQTDMEVDPPKNLSHEFLNELINEKVFLDYRLKMGENYAFSWCKFKRSICPTFWSF